ncbi:DgyrCDS2568 [Dimorphilus gyrociliatus]|uniref:DgyrCDS2568 n=1 Tax=Dimorphilus gyrociliatus TaxID=2664684 RepID=A0A7I8VFU8_9ANNE|nr:DgyrCDS2568 [Dimorphilus gyrociliatus]
MIDDTTVRRRKTFSLKDVKELDAFPKVSDSYQETRVSGGGVSLVTFTIILILTFSEIMRYLRSDVKYDYEVDRAHEGKIQLNIDITVAMQCANIGADVLDVTNENVLMTSSTLEEEDTYFDLTPRQRNYYSMMQKYSTYLKDQYHSLHKLLWKTGYMVGLRTSRPEREIKPTTQPDACRIHGTLEINKVAGNFHVTAGKPVPVIPRGHAHFAFIKERDYNFSHRIDHFSFGRRTPGLIYALDYDERVTMNNLYMAQYFLQVVPTSVNTFISQVDTYQFAVTHKNRTINHSKGSHGVPGIFFKYDLSPIKVKITEEKRGFGRLLIRLAGIVGGVFATSSILHSLLCSGIDLICCRFKKSTPDQIPAQSSLITPPFDSGDTVPAVVPTQPATS